MQEGAARLNCKGLGGKLGAIDVQHCLDAVLLENAGEIPIVALGDEFLNLLDLGFGEEGSGQLQHLKYFGVTRNIDGELALCVGNGITDIFLLQEQSDGSGAALRSCNVKRGVSVFITGVDVDSSGAVG